MEEALREFLLELIEMEKDKISGEKIPLLILLRKVLKDIFGEGVVREGDSLIVTTDFGRKFKTSIEYLD